METATPNPIILYDGVCGLCNWFVVSVLKRDARDRFRFASLQSDFAAKVLRRQGLSSQDLDTVYLIMDHGQPTERLVARSDAAVAVWKELGGVWRGLAFLLGLLPRTLRNWGYNLIARSRYRIFGKYDSCPLPDPKYRHRFLDLE